MFGISFSLIILSNGSKYSSIPGIVRRKYVNRCCSSCMKAENAACGCDKANSLNLSISEHQFSTFSFTYFSRKSRLPMTAPKCRWPDVDRLMGYASSGSAQGIASKGGLYHRPLCTVKKVGSWRTICTILICIIGGSLNI